MTANIVLPDRPKILVITLRRLGDVLMTTPLLRTLRRRWPQATLDFLVNAGSDRIVKGNPDIDQVMTIPARPSAAQMLALVPRLWRRYHLAVSTQAGDRPTLLALLAASPGRAGPAARRRRLVEGACLRRRRPGRPRCPPFRGDAAPG